MTESHLKDISLNYSRLSKYLQMQILKKEILILINIFIFIKTISMSVKLIISTSTLLSNQSLHRGQSMTNLIHF